MRTRVCICLGSSYPSLWPQMALFDFSLMMTRLIWVTCFRFQLTDSCLFSFLCVFRLLFHIDTNQLWSTGHSSKDWYWKCQWSDSSLPNYNIVIVHPYLLILNYCNSTLHMAYKLLEKSNKRINISHKCRYANMTILKDT